MADWREEMAKSKWGSSYEINGYGDLFYSLVKLVRPKKIVELGVKAGYSTYFMAKALKEIGSGNIDAYDLWEEYQFHSCKKSEAEENLKEFNGIINLYQQDVTGIEKNYENVDILHIDLGNHGEILDNVLLPWISKINSFVIIEGGSEERDKVDWIKKYNKTPLNEWFEKNKDRIEKFTFSPFPSLTLIKPKRQAI